MMWKRSLITVLGRVCLAGLLGLVVVTCSGREAVYQGKTVPEWIRLLDDFDPTARVRAVRVLAEVPGSDRRAAAALVQALEDQSGLVRRESAAALSRVGGSVASLLAQGLVPPRPNVEHPAEHVLVMLGSAAVPALQDVFVSAPPGSRESVLRTVGRLQVLAAAPMLTAALQDEDATIRAEAVWGLGRLGAAAIPSLPHITERVADVSPRVRRAVAVALGMVARPSPEAAQALVTLLGDDDGVVRVAAARALGDIRSTDPEVLQLLDEALAGDDPALQLASARAVGQLASPTSATASSLAAALASSDSILADEAGWAMSRLGDPAVEPLLAMASDRRKRVRGRAEAVLDVMGESAVDELARVLGGTDRKKRLAALGALKRMGPTAKGAIQALEAAAKDRDRRVRRLVAEVLRELERGAERS